MAAKLTKGDKQRLGSGQVKPRRQDYLRLSSGAVLTPAGLAGAISAADAGQIRGLVEIAEDVLERWAHLRGCFQTLALSVAGNPWELRAPAGSGRKGAKIAQAVTDMILGIPGIDRVPARLMLAAYHPLSAYEEMWDVSEGQAVISSLVPVHPKRFVWNTQYTGVAGLDLGELRLVSDENIIYGERLWDDKWLIHQTDYEGFPQRAGMSRGLCRLYLFSAEAANNQSIYGEVYGMPLRWAQVADQAEDDVVAAVEDALKNLGSDAYAVLKGTRPEFLQATPGGEKVYSQILEWANTECSKMVLGHTGSADSTPGKLGGEDAANEIRHDIVTAYARGVNESLTDQLVERLVRFNFGDGAPVPEWTMLIEEKRDLVEQANRVKIAVDMGVPVDMAWYAEQQGLTLAEDATLAIPGATKPAPTAPGGLAGLGLRAPGHDLVSLAVSKGTEKQVDSLIQSALGRAGDVYRLFTQPVREAFDQAADFDDLAARLGKIGLDPEPVATLLHETQLSGITLGIGQVAQESGQITKGIGAKWVPLPPEKAIKWLEDRIPVDREAFGKLSDQLKAKCFSLAGHDGDNLIAGVKDKLTAALRDGQSFQQFAKGYKEMMGSLGVEPTNPWHLETVFRTNTANAVQAGRYHQQTRPEVMKLRPYLQYNTVGDGSVRDEHAELDGLVYPAEHEFWSKHYPPNGFSCRCSVTSLSERQVTDRGIEVHDTIPDGLPEPDPGFASDPIGSLLLI